MVCDEPHDGKWFCLPLIPPPADRLLYVLVCWRSASIEAGVSLLSALAIGDRKRSPSGRDHQVAKFRAVLPGVTPSRHALAAVACMPLQVGAARAPVMAQVSLLHQVR